MKINRELFVAAAMALAIPGTALGCGGASAGTGDTVADEESTGPTDERDCSVEDCSDLTGPTDERDCSVEDCSDLTGPTDERDFCVEDGSDRME